MTANHVYGRFEPSLTGRNVLSFPRYDAPAFKRKIRDIDEKREWTSRTWT